MTRSTRILLTAFVIAVTAIGTLVHLSIRERDVPSPAVPSVAGPSVAGQVVRDNSHRLNSVPGSNVTFVEFLDFECEGCRAMYPAIEQLRATYGDRVNFVIRYFPLRGHYNAERAARAVEAAAQQGKLEPMYKKMYDTQSQWGEKRVPADDVFRGFATELGLNINTFNKAYAAAATAERVQLDVTDGRALGIDSTPTFFLNGQRLQSRGYAGLAEALDEALAR